jgi:hypothetical protein
MKQIIKKSHGTINIARLVRRCGVGVVVGYNDKLPVSMPIARGDLSSPCSV